MILKQAGFSLIEIMFVVVIAGIMTTMAVTAVKPKGQFYAAKQEVTKLQDILWQSRNSAITKSQCAILTRTSAQVLDLKTYAMPAPCTGPLPSVDFQSTMVFDATTSVSNFSSGNSVLTFNPRGGTTEATPVTIALTTPEGTTSFIIYPAIGQVRRQ